MPTVKNMPRDALALADTNNCAVVAVHALAEGEYSRVHRAFEQAGRKWGEGSTTDCIKGALRALGLEGDYVRRWIGSQFTVAALLAEISSDERLLVFTRSHVMAVSEGRVVDTCHRTRSKVLEVWRVRLASEPKSERPLLKNQQSLSWLASNVVELLDLQPMLIHEIAAALGVTERRARAAIDKARRDHRGRVVSLGGGRFGLG